jgi:hypothetical protein
VLSGYQYFKKNLLHDIVPACYQYSNKAVSIVRFCHNSESNKLNALPDNPFWWKHQYVIMIMIIVITTTFY